MRERNEQTKFQDSIKGVQEKLDKEFAEHVMRDVEKFNQEDKKRRQARLKELKDHQADILKQFVLQCDFNNAIFTEKKKTNFFIFHFRIAQNKKQLTKLQESERKSEMEDQKNMKKEIEDIEEKELRDVSKTHTILAFFCKIGVYQKTLYTGVEKKRESKQNDARGYRGQTPV